MARMSEMLAATKDYLDGLREELSKLLLERGVYKIPWGSGEYVRVPKGLHDLKASDLLALAEVVNKLTGGPQQPGAVPEVPEQEEV